MNLQASHPDPWISAVALDDKRIVKMVLETAQMYCTVTNDPTYRPTHTNHPVVIWARDNLSWLVRFHIALASEYYFRTGKTHKSFIDVGQHMRATHSEPTHFQNSAKSSYADFTHIADTHLAYRMYLNARWATDKRQPLWTRRGPPEWYDAHS